MNNKKIVAFRKRILALFLFLTFILVSFPLPVFAAGQTSQTQESVKQEVDTLNNSRSLANGIVTDFHSDITFNKKGDATITENIIVYFPYAKHGIYRWIPNEIIVKGVTIKQPISIKSVSYKKLPSTINTSLDYSHTNVSQSTSSGNYTVLKIGDADAVISGAYEYTISYTMKHAIRFFDDYQELYLNITGDQWEIPILKASTAVGTDAGIDYRCYTGTAGSTGSQCKVEKISGQTTFKTTADSTKLAEGMTIAIKFPTNTFTPPSLIEQIIEKVLPFLPLILPLLVAIYGFLTWRKFGKDNKITAIPPIFIPSKEIEQENLSVLASLLEMRPLPLSTLAEIIRIAEKGHLTISYENKKITLLISETQQKSLQEYLATQPASVEKIVRTLTNDFQSSSTINDLTAVYSDISTANKLAATEFSSTNYISKDSAKQQKIFYTYAGITTVAMFVLFVLINQSSNYTFIFVPIALLISSIILWFFGFIMLQRTKIGDEVTRELLGIKKYIKTAELKRLEFFNNPKEMISHFEKILPYAIILKLDKQWTNTFGPVLEQLQYEPTWMHSNLPFANTLPRTYAAMSSQMNSSMASISTPPQSSGSSFGGGGFSGGGSGGGGGGSW